jgi:hypothetical protein
MAGKLTAFPKGTLTELRRMVEAEAHDLAQTIAEDFDNYFDRGLRDLVVSGLCFSRADEGTIWLIDPERESLLPVFNSGPHASEFVGHFRQSLRSGMISMVVATEQPICENDVQQDHRQDRTLDTRLGLRTCAMIAAPFYFWGELRGVVSGVQVREADEDSPSPPGFNWEHLQGIQRTASLLGRLLEHKVLQRVLGMEGWV